MCGNKFVFVVFFFQTMLHRYFSDWSPPELFLCVQHTLTSRSVCFFVYCLFICELFVYCLFVLCFVSCLLVGWFVCWFVNCLRVFFSCLLGCLMFVSSLFCTLFLVSLSYLFFFFKNLFNDVLFACTIMHISFFCCIYIGVYERSLGLKPNRRLDSFDVGTFLKKKHRNTPLDME